MTSRLHLRFRIDPDPATSVTSPQRHRDTEPSHGATADHADERRSHRASHHHIVATTTARRHEDAARPCSGRHPCLPSVMRFQPGPFHRRDGQGHPAGETPAPQRRSTSPSRSSNKKEREWQARYNAGGAAVLRAQRPWRWVAGTNTRVRSGHTPSRWRRSKTAADSAALPACDESNQMRWIREIRSNPRSSVSKTCDVAMTQKCDVSVSLCASPCLCGSTATPAMSAMTQIKCDVSVSLSVSLCLCGSTATPRRTTDP